MSVLVNKDTRVLVQGITGREGGFQTERCIEYGTKVVAGCTPGRGGETAYGVPVFNTVAEAVEKAGPIDCSLIFVPAPGAADAILEAAAGAFVKQQLLGNHAIPSAFWENHEVSKAHEEHEGSPQICFVTFVSASCLRGSCPS